MTCTEFRRLNATDAAFRAMSRAELSSCHGHYLSCRKCQKFIRKTKRDKGDTKTLKETVKEALARHLEIANDPECKRPTI